MIDFDTLRTSKNIAEHLDDTELAEIGSQVLEGYKIDEDSISEWRERIDLAMDIAKQKMETKSDPWPGASNVKFPIITKASIDYASRSFQELVKSERVVRTSIIGDDPDLQKEQRAKNVSKFMSYQLLKESTDWEDDMDKLFHILPIVGTVFKKTYFNTTEDKIVSELCSPTNIVVNYYASSLESARRISHILTFYSNDVIERIRGGMYRDVAISKLNLKDTEDKDSPMELIEQHCFLDLDKDGYSEPYVVTIHKDSGEVLRIVNRFKEVSKNNKNQIKRIEADCFFTDYHFIKSPDGAFYSVGLGTILYPINETINTLINQLIDAGTLNNSRGGFIGRGLRLKGGEVPQQMNKWTVLDAASGTDIAKNIFQMPAKEPSGTLFQLLGLLIDVAKDLSNSTDLMQGKGQTQNVAASTVMAMIEQGTKTYATIQKRVFRSLRKEFEKIFNLDRKHISNSKYQKVLDIEGVDIKKDFDMKDFDVLPIADPSFSSDVQRIVRAEAIMALPTVDPIAKTKYYLQALDLTESAINLLVPKPDPNAPPPPDVIETMANVEKLKAQAQLMLKQAEQMEIEGAVKVEKNQIDRQKVSIQEAGEIARINEAGARSAKAAADADVNKRKTDLAEMKAQQEAMLAELKFILESSKAQHTAKVAEANVEVNANKLIKEATVDAAKIASDKKTTT